MKRPDTSNLTFLSTKDLFLAAGLLASGKKLIRLDWQDNKAFFVFLDREKCAEAEMAHWQGTLKVSTKAYADAIRCIKDRLYGNRHHEQPQPKLY